MQKTCSIISISLFFLFSGCASLFEADREPASYDRGYSEEAEEGTEDDSECVGRFCVPRGEDEDEIVAPAEKVDRVGQAISARDIVRGMTRNQVLQSWGEPAAREVAGTGEGGHERWRYRSRYSLQGERVLIFENGRVAGWHR